MGRPFARHRVIRIVPVLLLLVAFTNSLSAQLRPVFPSIYDSVVTHMPVNLRLQAVDRYGSRTFAVWSVWSIGPMGEDIGRLYGQLLVDGLPVGEAFPIHGATARPQKLVTVVAVRDGFLVLWNDYRKKPETAGIYARAVRNDGSIVGEREEFVSTGAMGTESERFGDPERGRVIRFTTTYWSNLLVIDATMRITGPMLHVLGLPVHFYYDGGLLPDRSVIELEGNQYVQIDERNVRIIDQDTLDRRLAGITMVSHDGRFSRVSHDSIVTYDSLRSETPRYASHVRDIDTLLGHGFILAANELGGVSAVYLKTVREDLKGYKPQVEHGTFIAVMLEQVFDANGSFRSIDTIARYTTMEGTTTSDTTLKRYVTVSQVLLRRTCPGRSVLKLWVDDRIHSSAGRYERRDGYILCAYGGPDGITLGCDKVVYDTASCRRPHPSGVTIARTRWDSISGVALTIDGDTLAMMRANEIDGGIKLLPDRTPRGNPRAVHRAGKAVLLYTLSSGVNSIVLDDPDGVFPIGPLKPVRPLRYTGPDGPTYPEPYRRIDTLESRHTVVTEARRPESYIVSRSMKIAELENSLPIDTFYTARDIFRFPVATGWVTVDDRFLQGDDNDPHDPRNVAADPPQLAWDPNSRRMMVYYSYGDRQSAGMIAESGSPLSVIRWTEPLYDFQHLLPETPGKYWGIIDDFIFRISNGITPLGSLPASPPGTIYARWFGSDILRHRLSEPNRIVIELCTVEPLPRRVREVEIVGVNPTVLLLTNPGDSTLTVLWSDSLGINAILYSRDLSRSVAQRRLVESRTVFSITGIHIGDSLHLVWEDRYENIPTLMRDAVPVPSRSDTAWGPSQLLAVDDIATGSSDDAIVTILPVPNPADTWIALRIDIRRASAVTLRLFDGEGRLVRRWDEIRTTAGVNRVPLDLEGLVPGAYTVHLDAGSTSSSTRFLIVR